MAVAHVHLGGPLLPSRTAHGLVLTRPNDKPSDDTALCGKASHYQVTWRTGTASKAHSMHAACTQPRIMEGVRGQFGLPIHLVRHAMKLSSHQAKETHEATDDSEEVRVVEPVAMYSTLP